MVRYLYPLLHGPPRPFRPWFTLSVFRLLLGQKRISTKADQAVNRTGPLEPRERYSRVGNRKGR